MDHFPPPNLTRLNLLLQWRFALKTVRHFRINMNITKNEKMKNGVFFRPLFGMAIFFLQFPPPN